MSAMPLSGAPYDDPLRLRELLQRFSGLAQEHRITSVLVGLSAPEGDLEFPELVDYLESALRVDDRIFRMTRERAVLFLADVDRAQAEAILERNLEGFCSHFARGQELPLQQRSLEVGPEQHAIKVKDVLPALFSREAPPE